MFIIYSGGLSASKILFDFSRCWVDHLTLHHFSGELPSFAAEHIQVAVQNNAPVQEELHRLGGEKAKIGDGDWMG